MDEIANPCVCVVSENQSLGCRRHLRRQRNYDRSSEKILPPTRGLKENPICASPSVLL